MKQVDYKFDDFTEGEYAKLLAIAKQTWRVVKSSEWREEGRVCIWRHDVDLSMHRALRMATLEADAGICASYFVLLRSPFYSVFEKEVHDILCAIIDMGHEVGLHFDGTRGFVDDRQVGLSSEECIRKEASILQDITGRPVVNMSFHNPDLVLDVDTKLSKVAGLENALGNEIQTKFSYCSDSNGYWRYRRLRDVLEAGEDQYLHVLTHPSLWVPQAMSPRARIARCIEGRAAFMSAYYDQILAITGRTNVR